jgi:hypothetical protein
MIVCGGAYHDTADHWLAHLPLRRDASQGDDYNGRMDTKRIVPSVLASIAALAAIGGGAPASAAPRCEASVHAELSHVERKELVTTYTYTVDVATLAPCATAHFALYSTERISKTKVKVFTTRGEVRLRNGSISKILKYDMPNGHEMVRWEVKATTCEPCEP